MSYGDFKDPGCAAVQPCGSVWCGDELWPDPLERVCASCSSSFLSEAEYDRCKRSAVEQAHAARARTVIVGITGALIVGIGAWWLSSKKKA